MRNQQNMIFRTESEAEDLVVSIVQDKWKYKCKRQFQINGKIPDIIAYKKSSDSLITVEIKLKNWKRVLYQAFINKNISDFSFICMPKNSYSPIKDKINDDLRKTGLGFVEIDPLENELIIKKIPEKNDLDFKRRENLQKIFTIDPRGKNGSIL